MKYFLVHVLLSSVDCSVIVQWRVNSPSQTDDWKPVKHWKHPHDDHDDDEDHDQHDWQLYHLTPVAQRRSFEDDHGHHGSQEESSV